MLVCPLRASSVVCSVDTRRGGAVSRAFEVADKARRRAISLTRSGLEAIQTASPLPSRPWHAASRAVLIQSRRKMSGSAGPPRGGAAMGAPANRRNTSAKGRPGTAGAGPSANCGATAGCDAVTGLWAAGVAGPEVPRPDIPVSTGGVSTGAGRGRGLRGRGAACVRPAVQRGCGRGVGTGTGSGDGGRFGTTWAGDTGAEAGRDGSSDGAVWGKSVRPSRPD